MADDEPPQTPEQSINAIRNALVRLEEQYPDSHAVKVLHRQLEKGFVQHGHLLGFNDDEVAALAGGGTPKLPPPGGGG